jgi:hypothetical protein
MPSNKDIRTNVIVSAEAKGFGKVGRETAKVTDQATKAVQEQAKGFAEAVKNSTVFERSMSRLERTFAGTSGDVKKKVQEVAKEFEQLEKMDFKTAQDSIGRLKRHLSELGKEQTAVTEVMSRMKDTADPAYKRLGEHLKTIGQESRETERRIRNLHQSFEKQAAAEKKAASDADKVKGAFAQGMAQGGFSLPAIGLKRGPGMGRQAAGMAVGMTLRGGINGARNFGSAAFGGVQGMAQSLSAIPYIGEFLGGQFQTAASYAQQAIQAEKTELENVPYFVGSQGRSARMQAQRAFRNDPGRRAQNELAAAQEFANLAQQQRGRYNRLIEANIPGRNTSFSFAKLRQAEGRTEFFENFAANEQRLAEFGARPLNTEQVMQGGVSMGLLRLRGNEMRSVSGKRLTAAASAAANAPEAISRAEYFARAGVQTDPFRAVERAGLQMGAKSRPEAIQMAGILAQTGGGFIPEAQQQGMVDAAFAAQTQYKIGMETSGAFLQAGRRGGLVGAQGRGGDAFKATIKEGLMLGLEGSELNHWMRTAAEGIQQFQQTGIPINTRSIAEMASGFAETGITGTRATSMARGLGAGLQAIGGRGVQSGVDHLMLQIFGGFQGGGAADYRQARRRMQELDFAGQGVGGIMANEQATTGLRQIMQMAGGDSASQNEMLQAILGRVGVQASVREFDMLGEFLRTGKGDAAAIEREQQRRQGGFGEVAAMERAGGLEAAARQTVGAFAGNVRAKAQLENEQIAIGRKLTDNVIALERASKDMVAAFENVAGGGLDLFTRSLSALSGKIREVTEGFDLLTQARDLIN